MLLWMTFALVLYLISVGPLESLQDGEQTNKIIKS